MFKIQHRLVSLLLSTLLYLYTSAYAMEAEEGWEIVEPQTTPPFLFIGEEGTTIDPEAASAHASQTSLAGKNDKEKEDNWEERFMKSCIITKPVASILGAFSPPVSIESEERPGADVIILRNAYTVQLRPIFKVNGRSIFELGDCYYCTTPEARNEERERLMAQDISSLSKEEVINYHIRMVNLTIESASLCSNRVLAESDVKPPCHCTHLGEDPICKIYKESSDKVAKYYNTQVIDVITDLKNPGGKDPQKLFYQATLAASALEKMAYYSSNADWYKEVEKDYYRHLWILISHNNDLLQPVSFLTESAQAARVTSYFSLSKNCRFIGPSLYNLLNGTDPVWKTPHGFGSYMTAVKEELGSYLPSALTYEGLSSYFPSSESLSFYWHMATHEGLSAYFPDSLTQEGLSAYVAAMQEGRSSYFPSLFSNQEEL